MYERLIAPSIEQGFFQLSQKGIKSMDTTDIELAGDKKRLQLENAERL